MTRQPPIAVLVMVVLIVTVAGCAQQSAKPTQASVSTALVTPPDRPSAAQEQRPAATPAPRPAPAEPQAPGTVTPSPRPSQQTDEFVEEPGLKDVLFQPGRADLDRAGTQVMYDNIRWMVENADYMVLIEGHTDYKGSREGNVAIGERRANAVASFLLKRGIPDTRLRTMSYGSDRPVCAERTDACAAQNRRVHFRVKPL